MDIDASTRPLPAALPEPLTGDDLEALRRSDTVLVRVLHVGGTTRGWLEAVSDDGPDSAAHRRLFPVDDHAAGDDTFPRRRVITIEARVSVFQDSAEQGTDGWVISDAFRGNAQARGIAAIARRGHVLTARVAVANNSDLIRDAGLFADTFSLYTEPPGRARRGRVEIEHTVVARDNSARAARPLGSCPHGTATFDPYRWAHRLDRDAALRSEETELQVASR